MEGSSLPDVPYKLELARLAAAAERMGILLGPCLTELAALAAAERVGILSGLMFDLAC